MTADQPGTTSPATTTARLLARYRQIANTTNKRSATAVVRRSYSASRFHWPETRDQQSQPRRQCSSTCARVCGDAPRLKSRAQSRNTKLRGKTLRNGCRNIRDAIVDLGDK